MDPSGCIPKVNPYTCDDENIEKELIAEYTNRVIVEKAIQKIDEVFTDIIYSVAENFAKKGFEIILDDFAIPNELVKSIDNSKKLYKLLRIMQDLYEMLSLASNIEKQNEKMIVVIIALARKYDINQLAEKKNYYDKMNNENLSTLYRAAEGLKSLSYEGSIYGFDKVIRNDNNITKSDISTVLNYGGCIELGKCTFFNIAVPSIYEFLYVCLNLSLDLI